MWVACVLVTHFRAKVEMLRHPHLKDSPVLIVDRGPVKSGAKMYLRGGAILDYLRYV